MGNYVDNPAERSDYQPGSRNFTSHKIPKPKLCYPLTLKQNLHGAPFVHLNVVDPVASAPRSRYAIGLYMPESVKVSYNANWQEIELGLVGGEAVAMATQQGALSRPFTSMLGFSNFGSAILAQAGLNLAQYSATNIGAAAQIAAGIQVNPHAALLFQGMAFREFQLDFTFFPKNEQESFEVEEIIFQLKYAMHPEGSEGIAAGRGATAAMSRFFLYPNNFIIGFYAPNIHWLFRTSPCALTRCDVEYHGAGVPAYFDTAKKSSPAVIRMSLGFKENEILTKQRIRQGW